MWLGIFAGVTLIAIFAIVFLMRGALRFGFCKKLYERNKPLGILSSIWPIVICLPFLFVGFVAFVIAFIHLFFFWVLTDLTVFIIRKLAKKGSAKRYINGFIAISLTVIYLTYGWIMAHNVIQTDYDIKTDKSLGKESFRVVAIADLHSGITLDGDDFLEECKRINALKPDIVVVCGDFVDDDTSREDMIKSCEALGTLDTKYGVFFVYGNHDRGYFRNGAFSTEELYYHLSKNKVKVLSDETVAINDNMYIIGREDASRKDRKTAQTLMQGIDPSKFVIMLDHQPTDYDAIAKGSPDLVISGHTHGGHIFPAGQIGMLMGANDFLYGLEKQGNTSFIVTSGISGWAIPFKTLTVSEFVVIDIEN
ncbi:MAG: metallophosphoesterase [Clostridia bacterium]|nr:metallophosphoesterase [Clostridia bacterium]